MTDQARGQPDRYRAAAPVLPVVLALMLAVFTISVGFGILLPQLPLLIARLLGAGGTPVQVSRATGFMSAIYMLALFVAAPVWGRVSDRWGRRPVLLVGLAGFGATMIGFGFFETLTAVYVERALSGLFAAAVTPVALAAVTDITASRDVLGRRLTFVSLAGVSGFLLGPAFGLALMGGGAGGLALPLRATGGLALVAALAVALTLRPTPAPTPGTGARRRGPAAGTGVRLLALAFVVSAGVAVFEVALALRGQRELGFAAGQIAAMFTLCSGVMIAVQALVFSPLVRPVFTRWLIAPALAVMAAGLVAVPLTADFGVMLGVIAAIAASAGILSPILTYWTASQAGHKSGADLGSQTAFASLGAAAGSAAGGVLYDVAWLPNASFVLMAAVLGLAVWPALTLPRRLLPRA